MEDDGEYFDNWGTDEYEDDFSPSILEDFYYEQAIKAHEQELSQISREKEQLEGAVKPVRMHYDDSGYYAYVLLDGDIRARDETMKRLNDRNIYCIHTGTSYKPANNRNQYQWYIRVIEVLGNQLKKPAKETINDLFVSVWGLARESEFTTDIQQLQAHLEKIKDEKRILENKLEIIHSELDYDKKRYESLNVEYLKQKSKFQSQAASLRKENNVLLHQNKILIERETDSNKEDEIRKGFRKSFSNLNSIISKRDKEIEGLVDEWQTSENKIKQLNDQMIKVESERDITIDKCDQLKKEIKKLEENEKKKDIQLNSLKTPRSNYESDFRKALSCLLYNIILNRGSISFLLHEIKDFTDALSELKLLNSNTKSLRAKRIQVAPSWKEIKFNTGENGKAGRIYYAKLRNSTKYDVLVSHKKLQKLDIKSLKKRRVE